MEIITHKCPTCSADLVYDIKNKNWKCKFCRVSHQFEDVNKRKYKSAQLIDELFCPTCKAKLLISENVISTKCVYCRNNLVINKNKDGISIPDKIIPFSITKEMAIKQFFTALNDKKLLPSDFDLEKNIVDTQGIYVPFWLYSNKYSVVVRDEYSRILKKIKIAFNLIPYDANKHLDNKITSALEPFDYKDLINFDSSYLTGVVAQKYDISSDIGANVVDDRCKTSIHDIFERKFKRVSSEFYISRAKTMNETLISQDKYYALFPVWLFSVKYHNKIYLIAINGQTGKIAGDLPIDRKHYVKTAVIVYLMTFTFLLIFTLILRWLGVL